MKKSSLKMTMPTKSVIVISLLEITFWFAVNVKSTLAIYSPSMETEIKNETALSHFYDPECRPNAETHVKVGLSVIAIDELDLKGQKLTMAGWLTFEWQDERIHWNKTEKDDIEYIFLKPDHIWKPELIVDNALQDHDIISRDALFLRLKYDGTVDWEPPMLFVTQCEVDITFYPYDHQKCAVEIVSWSYTIEEVKLDHLFDEVNLEDFKAHGEWELIDTELEDKNLTEHLPNGVVRIYPQIAFWVYMRRRTQFYNLNVIMPLILTSLMVVMVFIVPVDSGEKVSYVLTVFLTMAVLLTIVTDSLPPTSISMSVLGLYLGIVLIFSAAAILLTILILIVSHREGQPEQNSFLLTTTRFAAKLMCRNVPGSQTRPKETLTSNKVASNTDNAIERAAKYDFDYDDASASKDSLDNGTCIRGPSGKNCKTSWKDVAHILDRFCFFSFTFVTVLMNLAFMVTLVTGGRYTM